MTAGTARAKRLTAFGVGRGGRGWAISKHSKTGMRKREQHWREVQLHSRILPHPTRPNLVVFRVEWRKPKKPRENKWIKKRKKGMGYLGVRRRETTKKARAQVCTAAGTSGIIKGTQKGREVRNIYSRIQRIVKQAGAKEGCSRCTACHTQSKEKKSRNRCLPISIPTGLVVHTTYCPDVDFRMNCQPSPHSCPSLASPLGAVTHREWYRLSEPSQPVHSSASSRQRSVRCYQPS